MDNTKFQELFYIGCRPLKVEMRWVIEIHRTRPHLNRNTSVNPLRPSRLSPFFLEGSMCARLERAMHSVNIDVQYKMLN